MDALKTFISLLVLINPLGNIPMFISLTANQTHKERRKTARIASIAVMMVIIVSGFLGDWIIRFFGISIPSFQVGGGILILLVSISMLNAQIGNARQTNEEKVEAEHKANIAVVPLAIPMLAGPGAMSAVIIYAQRIQHWYEYLYLIAGATGIGILIWLALSLADPISRAVGQTGINIATRIMGLLLSAISVEFMVNGLIQLIPALGRS
ncbi:YchE family NAAT transporter [Burkholderiaceae bacterium DAT-1]|nr:YchE family NAAT transporter [Burkholderiaceae bacterium DAT-1]